VSFSGGGVYFTKDGPASLSGPVTTGGDPQEVEMKQLQNAIGLRFALMLSGVSVPSLKREEGQTFVEYALILATIGIAVTVALTFLRDKIINIFSTIGNAL
jgi:Flp pilus assembly pilin Flp